MTKGGLAAKATQAHFEREKALVEYLSKRLELDIASISNPNANAEEAGVDVLVYLVDGRTIGIQVTELDPHPSPGKARAQETWLTNGDTSKVYGGWGQNDLKMVLDSLVRTIKRKVNIAARHSIQGTEAWLLVCGGIPDAAVSTFVMSPWLSGVDMNKATDGILRKSKYDRCFFLPMLGVEQAFSRWEQNRGWKKSVKLDELYEIPREVYVRNLFRAADANDWNEVDRLCDEECRKVLSEMRST